MEDIHLDDIESVDESGLIQSRLDNLENGYSSFDEVLEAISKVWSNGLDFWSWVPPKD